MNWFKTVVINVGIIACLATVSFGEDKLGFTFSTDYFGKYVWRGQNLNDDPVLQPGLSASYNGFTAGIWGNLETTDIHDSSGEFTELDYSVGYAGDVPGVEKLGFSVGAIYYDFPNTTYPATTELYGGLSYDCILKPSITFYQDIDEADGMYISAGVSHSIENIFKLAEDVPVNAALGASLGWADSSYNKYYWGLKDSAFNDLKLSVALPFEVAGWTVNPSASYVMLVDSDIKDTDAYGTDDDIVYFGIGLSRSF
jgi:hypothetical protein